MRVVDAGVDDGLRVIAPQAGCRIAGVEQTGIEEIGADAPGFQRELAEAQDLLLQGKTQEFALILLHGSGSGKKNFRIVRGGIWMIKSFLGALPAFAIIGA